MASSLNPNHGSSNEHAHVLSRFSRHLALHIPENWTPRRGEVEPIVRCLLEILEPKFIELESEDSGALKIERRGLTPFVRLVISWLTAPDSPAGQVSPQKSRRQVLSAYIDSVHVGDFPARVDVPTVQYIGLPLMRHCTGEAGHAGCHAFVSESTVEIRQKSEGAADSEQSIDIESCMRVEAALGFRARDVRGLQDRIRHEARDCVERFLAHLREMQEIAIALGNIDSAERSHEVEREVTARLSHCDFTTQSPASEADLHNLDSSLINPFNQHQDDALVAYALAHQGARTDVARLEHQHRRLQAIEMLLSRWTLPDEAS